MEQSDPVARGSAAGEQQFSSYPYAFDGTRSIEGVTDMDAAVRRDVWHPHMPSCQNQHTLGSHFQDLAARSGCSGCGTEPGDESGVEAEADAQVVFPQAGAPSMLQTQPTLLASLIDRTKMGPVGPIGLIMMLMLLLAIVYYYNNLA